MAVARGNHWLQMAKRCILGSVCLESLTEILRFILLTIFSMWVLSLLVHIEEEQE